MCSKVAGNDLYREKSIVFLDREQREIEFLKKAILLTKALRNTNYLKINLTKDVENYKTLLREIKLDETKIIGKTCHVHRLKAQNC